MAVSEVPRRPWLDTSRPQEGSAWILAPTAMLVILVLAAISVNSAATYLAQRQLANTAASAAIAGAGATSQSAFYHSGLIVLSPRRAGYIARRAVAAEAPRSATLTSVSVTIRGGNVCVSLSATVRPVFAANLIGRWATTPIRASAVASPVLYGNSTSSSPVAGCGEGSG